MLLALVAATGGLLTWANYVKSTGLLQEEVHRKARSIASTTATLLDPDVIKAIRGRSDETRAEYAQLRAQLRAVRDANRREDVWVERLAAQPSFCGDPNNARVRAIIIAEDDEKQLLENFMGREAALQPLRARVSWLYGRWLKQEAEAKWRHRHSVAPMGDAVRAGPASDRVSSISSARLRARDARSKTGHRQPLSVSSEHLARPRLAPIRLRPTSVTVAMSLSRISASGTKEAPTKSVVLEI